MAQHARPRWHLQSASAYREERGNRFASWAEITGTERAAERGGEPGRGTRWPNECLSLNNLTTPVDCLVVPA
jgi:hypothetical protein